MKYVFPRIQRKYDTAWDKYFSTGKFMEAIPEIRENETPENGDLRKYNNIIYQYNADTGKYAEIARTLTEGEKPENGALRIWGNTIYQYNAGTGKYRIYKELPEKFLAPAPKPKPSVFQTEYWKQTAENIPESAWNFLKSQYHLLKDLGLPPPRQKGEPVGKYITKELGRKGKALGMAAVSPPLIVYRALKHPLETLREDPVGFVLGALILKGGFRYASNKMAKYYAQEYIKGKTLIDEIRSIPDSKLAKFGDPKVIKERVTSEILKEAKYPLRGSFQKPMSFRGMKDIGIKPLKKLEQERLMQGGTRGEGGMPEIGELLLKQPKRQEVIKGIKQKPPEKLPSLEEQIAEFYKKNKVEKLPPGVAEGAVESRLTEGLKITPTPETKFHSGLPLDELINKFVKKTMQKPMTREVMRHIAERSGKVKWARFEIEKEVSDLTKGLSKREREAVPYIREKISDPSILEKIGRKDLIPLIKNPSSRLQEAVKKVGETYEKDWKFMKEHYDAKDYVENYVTQIWDVPRKQRSQFINYFKQTNYGYMSSINMKWWLM